MRPNAPVKRGDRKPSLTEQPNRRSRRASIVWPGRAWQGPEGAEAVDEGAMWAVEPRRQRRLERGWFP